MKKYFLLWILTVFSCSTKKDVLYMQDIDNDTNYSNSYSAYKIKIDDILKIDIIADNPEIAQVVDPSSASNKMGSTKESWLFNGYQVDTDGYINVPNIGQIYVLGLTLKQVKSNINNFLIQNDILIRPVVDVKIINLHFTVLGEVKNPGRYEFLKNNLNILEAIGMAGDLTINGKRKDIKLIRNTNENNMIFDIDLTSANFIKNDGFQIFSGDIILVNPNTTRIKNAGIIGNSGTLVSLLSFILSSIIVISN